MYAFVNASLSWLYLSNSLNYYYLLDIRVKYDYETFDALPSSFHDVISHRSMRSSFLIHAQIQFTLHTTDTHYARPHSKHSQQA